MAPKGSKRAAADGAGSPAKKRPAANPALPKCRAVEAAINGAGDALPAGARALLSALVESSLATPKEERHAFQANITGMVGQAMTAIDAHLEKEVQEAKAKSDGVPGDRALRQKALAAAKEEEAALEAVVAQKKEALAAAEASCGAAAEALTAAKAALKVVETPLLATEDDKAKVVNAVTILEAFKSKSSADEKKNVKTLMDAGKDFSLDASLLESLATVLKKEPADRGGFDTVVIDNLSEALAKKVAEFDAALAASAGPRAEKADAVKAAEAALEAANHNKEAAAAEVGPAKEAVREGAAAIKGAQKRVEKWLPDSKVVMDAYDDSVVDLSNFRSEAMMAFEGLKDLAPEPEEPEPAPAEEAPAEEAPAEGAPAQAVEASADIS